MTGCCNVVIRLTVNSASCSVIGMDALSEIPENDY